MRSARVLRDRRDYEDLGDEVLLLPPVEQKRGRETSASLFALLMALAVGGGALLVPRFMAEGGGDSPSASKRSSSTQQAGLRGFVRKHAAVRLVSDFRERATEWTPARGAGDSKRAKDGWTFQDGFARPGRFRVWQPSMQLSDYHMEFAGQIERKGMSWGWRASDEKNYYGSRLVVVKPGPLPEVHLVRWAMVDGHELKRIAMRLPMTVRSDTVYKIQVTVTGADISTAINGEMVDTWSDERFDSGGVAFFANQDESALLRYVSVTQRDTLLGRVLAYLGMLHPSRIPIIMQ